VNNPAHRSRNRDDPSLEPGSHVIAAIDIGTNSIHLAVAQVNPRGHFKILDSDKVSVRLGQHMTAGGDIDAEGIAKTVTTMRQMKEICAAYPCHIRAIATHAVREAGNHQALIDRVFRATGIRIEVVDGDEEGRLVFLGMKHGNPLGDKPVLALDIGGGSTEIVFGRGEQISLVTSLKLGAVNLSVAHGLLKKVDGNRLQDMRNAIASRLEPVIENARLQKFAIAVAASGTAKALASINPGTMRVRQGVEPNGQILRAADLETITTGLRRLGNPSAIRMKTGLDASRSEIILAGAELLSAITRGLGVRQWMISGYGLREGIVIDTWQRLEPDRQLARVDVREESIRTFANRFDIDRTVAAHTVRLALRIFDQMAPWALGHFDREDRKHLRRLLESATWIHDCGLFVSRQAYHRHSHYLIAHSHLLGFTQDERTFMSLIARFHRKSVPPKGLDPSLGVDLAADEWAAMRTLSGVLRLAAALNRTRGRRVRDVLLKRRGNNLQITVLTGKTSAKTLNLHKAGKEVEALQKCWDVRISLDS